MAVASKTSVAVAVAVAVAVTMINPRARCAAMLTIGQELDLVVRGGVGADQHV